MYIKVRKPIMFLIFMKKLLFIILLSVLSSFSYNNFITQKIKIISYNIRYNNPNDGKDIWENRKSAIVNFVLEQNPDFLGLQEVTQDQLLYLSSKFSNYNYLGVGRDDGKSKGEYSPIYYNKFNYNLILSNTFWLSETPKNISVGWDASMERICTYGLFTHNESGIKVWVFNTHFDHIGEIAREKSVDLILSKIKELTQNKDRVIITGDFNLMDDSKPIKKLQKSFNDVNINMIRNNKLFGTFNDFVINSISEKRIDYIFQKNLILINSTHGHIKTNNGRWASDHHPVISVLKL